MSNQNDFCELLARQQAVQDVHDSKAHKEIWLLPRVRRLSHLCHHMTKYLGRIAARFDQDVPEITLADSFLVALSMSNVMGLKLSDAEVELKIDISMSNRLAQWTLPVSRIAKVCEAHDHMENMNYKSEAEAAILEILSILLKEARISGVDIAQIADKRRNEILDNVLSF